VTPARAGRAAIPSPHNYLVPLVRTRDSPVRRHAGGRNARVLLYPSGGGRLVVTVKIAMLHS
jgi:hypothetical protein